MKYTIELNFNARIVETVDANDEGEALTKASKLAENADMNEFILTHENESRILAQN